MRSLLFTAVLFLCLPSAVLAEDLSGLWIGQFKYQDSDQDGKFLFSAVLDQNGKVITGKIIEKNTFGYETWKYLSSDIIGECSEGRFTGYKKYDGTGLQNHVVIYSGTVAGGRISGQWEINGRKGPFEMRLVDAAQFTPIEKPSSGF